MAIRDVKEFAHLSQEDVEALGREFDQIRSDIEESRGDDDAAYIRRLITVQRRLNVAARVMMFGSNRRELWWAGALTLGVAKILENMEIGHNVMHGEWDWMNDPEIHSSTWEWDNVCPADQ
ncbi:MAG: NADPH-dependent stearoyl-CoA 9-desaturase, partial [Actinomycetota bacterium]|nr:NADPH-dependent stearoyl-CoA 9-desaturase [Actinomycetota bacterium]